MYITSNLNPKTSPKQKMATIVAMQETPTEIDCIGFAQQTLSQSA